MFSAPVDGSANHDGWRRLRETERWLARAVVVIIFFSLSLSHTLFWLFLFSSSSSSPILSSCCTLLFPLYCYSVVACMLCFHSFHLVIFRESDRQRAKASSFPTRLSRTLGKWLLLWASSSRGALLLFQPPVSLSLSLTLYLSSVCFLFLLKMTEVEEVEKIGERFGVP